MLPSAKQEEDVGKDSLPGVLGTGAKAKAVFKAAPPPPAVCVLAWGAVGAPGSEGWGQPCRMVPQVLPDFSPTFMGVMIKPPKQHWHLPRGPFLEIPRDVFLFLLSSSAVEWGGWGDVENPRRECGRSAGRPAGVWARRRAWGALPGMGCGSDPGLHSGHAP